MRVVKVVVRVQVSGTVTVMSRYGDGQVTVGEGQDTVR
jgi:hypothetical protein